VPRFDFATASPAEQETELLLLPYFQGPTQGPGMREVARALDTDLDALLHDNRLAGRFGEVFTVPTLGRGAAGTVMLLGLGKREEVDADIVRRAIGKVAPRAARYRSVATTLPQASRGGWQEAVQAVVEGLLLGSYRFDRYKVRPIEEDGERPQVERVTVLGSSRWDARGAREAIRRGQVFADAASWTRDLVNIPALDATPEFLAAEARKMATKAGLKSKVWTKGELERGGFGGILGVGRGSENQPRMIELTYAGGSGPPVALTGKGVTFDSGGLSIKDAHGMEWMKADMAGAATVLGAMRAIAELQPRVNVIAAIPSAENMPGGSSIRPGDVLTHRGGKTSEVLNTDAEGRLILADALAYLVEKNPRSVVDMATLTGACMIALGEEIWGVMGSDRRVIDDLLASGREVGEPGWELPLWGRYRKQIESSVADVKNIGQRWGGAITAALFLKEFVGDVPWAHMDIAGTAFAERAGDYWPKGATGNPVRTVIRYVERQAGRRDGARRKR
jgi:leucyl aminopeptidase